MLWLIPFIWVGMGYQEYMQGNKVQARWDAATAIGIFILLWILL